MTRRRKRSEGLEAVTLVDANELADRLQISKASLYQLVHRGQLPENCLFRVGKRRLRFDLTLAMRALVSSR